jgi:methionine aminotransferase
MNSKFPGIGTSIFAVMSKMANDHGAINLSQGFPNFECSPELITLVEKYMRQGFNQYAPMEGIMPLREIIAQKTEELYGAKYNPDKEITITSGATEGLYAAISAFIKEDDEVIIFEPSYDSYGPIVRMNGGRPIYVQLKHPYYTIDWDLVKKSITARTKMIIINSPNNPSGAVLSEADLEKLKKLTDQSKIIILSDEVYEHIIFDGYIHQSVTRHPELVERSIVLSSFGKTYHTTGWKLGYCVAPEHLTKEIRKVHQFLVFAVNTPAQYAVAEFLKQKDLYLQLGDFYKEKRDYFNKLLSCSRFIIRPSSGTYFQLLSYNKISNEKDTVFAERLTKEIGVASIPVSAFYHEGVDNKVLRFCFAKNNETLEKAAEKLIKL